MTIVPARRRIAAPASAKHAIIIAQLAGSGTAAFSNAMKLWFPVCVPNSPVPRVTSDQPIA